jgi:hypothetical protein
MNSFFRAKRERRKKCNGKGKPKSSCLRSDLQTPELFILSEESEILGRMEGGI